MLAAAAVAAAAAIALMKGETGPLQESAPLEPTGGVVASTAVAVLAVPPTGEGESARPLQRRSRSSAAAPSAPRRLRPHASVVRGQAIDPEGRALVGVEIYLASERERRGRTDANGQFEVSTALGHDLFRVAPSSGYVAIASSRAGSPGEALVVAAPSSAPLHLEITDAATGRPLSHAAASIDVTPWLTAFEVRQAALHPLLLQGASDATGAAFLANVPDLPGLVVTVRREGYRTRSVSVDGQPALALSVALERFSSRDELNGRVVSQTGAPVSGAEIAARGRFTRSRADGSFTLRLLSVPEAGAAPMLFAYHPTHGTAQQTPDTAAELELVLEPRPATPPRALRFESGAALASVRVVPVGPDGAPDRLAPHWQCSQSDATGKISLAAQRTGDFGKARVAISKDGTALGRVELDPSGEAWIVIQPGRSGRR